MSASHVLGGASHAVVSSRLNTHRSRGRVPRSTNKARRGVSIKASASPVAVTVTVNGKITTCEIPGAGGVVGKGKACDCVIDASGVDSEHCKLEVRQGRIFVTSIAKNPNGVFLGGNKLFPGVAYPVLESSDILLGESADKTLNPCDVTLTVSQKDGGAGTEGVDMMSKMMQMQFEASLDPEIKKALEE